MPRERAFTLSDIEDAETQAKEEPEVVQEPRKEFKLKLNRNSMVEIFIEGGGVVPTQLRGMWTKAPLAEKAIANYLRERDAKAAG